MPTTTLAAKRRMTVKRGARLTLAIVTVGHEERPRGEAVTAFDSHTRLTRT
jgi:hypothetical protein